jgi:hypothetical protein
MFLFFTLYDGRGITLSALHIISVFPKKDADDITRVNMSDGKSYDLKDAYDSVNQRLKQAVSHG